VIHACIESSCVVQALRLNLQGSKTLFSIHSVLIGRNGCEELLLEKNIDDLVFFYRSRWKRRKRLVDRLCQGEVTRRLIDERSVEYARLLIDTHLHSGLTSTPGTLRYAVEMDVELMRELI